VGNGDVKTIEEAHQKARETGVDGVMIGRGVFGTPWLFSETGSSGHHKFPAGNLLNLASSRSTADSLPFRSVSERLEILVEHTKLFEELLGDIKSFAIMKKHFKAYVEGFDGAKDLRMQLMEAKNAVEVEEVINTFLRDILK
jgi:tRNA-dihydrouridine synthase